jgi:hypothetical protein
LNFAADWSASQIQGCTRWVKTSGFYTFWGGGTSMNIHPQQLNFAVKSRGKSRGFDLTPSHISPAFPRWTCYLLLNHILWPMGQSCVPPKFDGFADIELYFQDIWGYL